MKKLLKNILIFIFGISVILTFIWFYGSNQILTIINSNFANRDFKVGNSTVNFKKATIAGYPFKMGVDLENFRETNDEGYILYEGPVKLGYDIFFQRFYINYNGIATATSKKKDNNKFKITGVFCLFYNKTKKTINF